MKTTKKHTCGTIDNILGIILGALLAIFMTAAYLASPLVPPAYGEEIPSVVTNAEHSYTDTDPLSLDYHKNR